jgi:hypothetical protein
MMAVVSRSALLRTFTNFSVRCLSTDIVQRIAENRADAIVGGGEKKVAAQHRKVLQTIPWAIQLLLEVHVNMVPLGVLWNCEMYLGSD